MGDDRTRRAEGEALDGYYHAELARWAGRGPIPPIVWERLDEGRRASMIRGAAFARRLATHRLMRIVGVLSIILALGIMAWSGEYDGAVVALGLVALAPCSMMIVLGWRTYMIARPPTSVMMMRWEAQRRQIKLLARAEALGAVGGEISEVGDEY